MAVLPEVVMSEEQETKEQQIKQTAMRKQAFPVMFFIEFLLFDFSSVYAVYDRWIPPSPIRMLEHGQILIIGKMLDILRTVGIGDGSQYITGLLSGRIDHGIELTAAENKHSVSDNDITHTKTALCVKEKAVEFFPCGIGLFRAGNLFVIAVPVFGNNANAKGRSGDIGSNIRLVDIAVIQTGIFANLLYDLRHFLKGFFVVLEIHIKVVCLVVEVVGYMDNQRSQKGKNRYGDGDYRKDALATLLGVVSLRAVSLLMVSLFI